MKATVCFEFLIRFPNSPMFSFRFARYFFSSSRIGALHPSRVRGRSTACCIPSFLLKSQRYRAPLPPTLDNASILECKCPSPYPDSVNYYVKKEVTMYKCRRGWVTHELSTTSPLRHSPPILSRSLLAKIPMEIRPGQAVEGSSSTS